MIIKAVYENNVLKPLEKLDLKEGEVVEIEVTGVVRRTKGIIRIDRESAREIAESDELSVLDA